MKIKIRKDLNGQIIPYKPIEAFNVWYPTRDKTQIARYKWGTVDKHILQQILFHYTNEDDYVVDIMSGRGYTKNICLGMKRKCDMFDIDPQVAGVIKHDATKMFDFKYIDKYDFGYWDAPYFDLKVKDAFDNDVNKFYTFISDCAKNLKEIIKMNGRIAFVMCDKNIGEFQPLCEECYNILKNVGFKWVQTISAPLLPQQNSYMGALISKVRRKERMPLGIRRVIYIFERVSI